MMPPSSDSEGTRGGADGLRGGGSEEGTACRLRKEVAVGRGEGEDAEMEGDGVEGVEEAGRSTEEAERSAEEGVAEE